MTDADRALLETELATLANQDVAEALNAAQPSSETADIIAGEMERRGIDT